MFLSFHFLQNMYSLFVDNNLLQRLGGELADVLLAVFKVNFNTLSCFTSC